MAKDPVCGMDVDEKATKNTTVYRNKTYYFCSPGCKTTFDKNPDRYVGQKTGSEGSGHH